MELAKLQDFFKGHTDAGAAALLAFMRERGIAGGERYVRAMLPNLLQRLYDVTHKVLLAHYKILSGSASFDDFCASLDDPGVRDFFHGRYPVMQRWMDAIAHSWVEQASQLVARFEADQGQIARNIFGSEAPLEVLSVRMGMGDLHRGGRSVAQIEFADGRKLIYKPRSLQIDVHFAELVAWLCNEAGMALRMPQTLARGEYGWVKFIDPRECADNAEVADYYERLGNWLALLYLLEGTDFHYENIIADGPYPMLIDLESFFHPASPMQGNEVTDYMDNSVLRTGILPTSVESGTGMPDISGISEVEGSEGLLEALFLMPDEDGGVRFERARGVMAGARNVPRLNGKSVQITSAVVKQLQRGFTHMYGALLERREAVAAWLARFEGDEVRVLFRHTATYAHLLQESTHPSLMRDPQLVDQHFGLLSLIIPGFQAAAQFVGFEIADMLRRDVPLLTTRVGSRALWYADDGCIPDFFRVSGYDGVLAKLAALSVEDLHHQRWLIGKSLNMIETLAGARSAAPAAPAGDYASAGALQQRLVQEALRVGDYVASQIHVEGDYANWIVVKAVSLDNRKMELLPAFYDLYAGLPGEILFLSQLSRLTGEPSYGALADKALNTLEFKLARSGHMISALGLYMGWGSVIFTLASLGAARADAGYFARIEQLFDTLDFGALIAADKHYSVIKGAAGFIIACTEYHLASGSPRALALAEQAAAHLLRKRHAGGAGYSWLITSAVPLSGMAHGASGFATAFARLYQATGDQQYAQVSLGALDYERTLFVAEQQNWEDCREVMRKVAQGQAACSTAWSHGAPGIGLARLELLRSGIGGATVEEELRVAAASTARHGFGGSQSLIFGSFGNFELMLAGREYGAGVLEGMAAPAAAHLMRDIDRNGWQLENRNFIPLGMMAGVTGIGYQCLRAAFPGQVPSILGGRSSVLQAQEARLAVTAF